MYTKNVPAVPVLESKNVIDKINARVMQLDDEERQEIESIISCHECEPMAVAEKISELLNVSYQSIFDLL